MTESAATNEVPKVMAFGDYGVHDGIGGGAGDEIDDGFDIGVHDKLGSGFDDGAVRPDTIAVSDKEGVDMTAPSKSGSPKKRKVTGVAKEPTKAMLKFSTTSYALYNPALKNAGHHVEHPHVKFDDYNSYSLFMIPNVKSVKKIPTEGVRLDDLHVAIVIDSGAFSKKQLNENWKAEFDVNGMVRGLRVPLGHAAKAYKKVGDVDIDGNVLEAEDEGWYYLWHRGLHMLGGQESLDAGIYKKRPAFEKDLCTGTTFKKAFPAVLQYPPGHADDAMFEEMPLYTKLTLEETELTKLSSSQTLASTSGTKEMSKPSSSETSTNTPAKVAKVGTEDPCF